MNSFRVLSSAQVDQFLERGHIILHDCFSREAAAEWTGLVWNRLGFREDDPSTWTQSRIHMPAMHRVDASTFAPQFWDAVCDLCGGAERVRQPCSWGDSFIVNLRDGIDRPWEPPSPRSPGWHKDGDFFRHFLDSPEQGLLVIVFWSDVEHHGGGTFAACDSIGPVARFLSERPEGVLPGEFRFSELVSRCTDFVELTGQIGDVALIHPFVLHASSQNHLGIPRLITNPPVSLREPMQFARENPDEFSLVEKAILRALDRPSLAFRPSHEREAVVPERVRRQQKMLEDERARLAAAKH